jgi:hypothetical protein
VLSDSGPDIAVWASTGSRASPNDRTWTQSGFWRFFSAEIRASKMQEVAVPQWFLVFRLDRQGPVCLPGLVSLARGGLIFGRLAADQTPRGKSDAGRLATYQFPLREKLLFAATASRLRFSLRGKFDFFGARPLRKRRRRSWPVRSLVRGACWSNGAWRLQKCLWRPDGPVAPSERCRGDV